MSVPPPSPKQPRPRVARFTPFAHAIMLMVLGLVALGATLLAWESARRAVGKEAELEFAFRSARTAEAIAERTLDYEQVLRGAVGFFVAQREVERDEWRHYVEVLHLELAYPGIQAIAFSRYLHHADLADYERRIRDEGFAAFAVHPPGRRADYVVTEFIEPFTGRNRGRLGFDALAEPTRRTALEHARDTGSAAITAPIAPPPGASDASRASLVMYMPVYRGQKPPEGTVQRRAQLVGFVSAPFRAEDLLASLMRSERQLGFELFDGPVASGSEPIYRSPSLEGAREPRFSGERQISAANRAWTLRVSSLPAFEREAISDRPRIILVSGLSITALLLALLFSVLRTRSEALQLAGEMTQALRENQERLGLALSASGVAIFDWDIATGRVHLSEQWAAIVHGEPGPRTTTIEELNSLIHPEDAEDVREKVRSLLAGEIDLYRIEHRVRTADLGWTSILSQAKVAERDAAGQALRVIGTNADISALRELERLKSSFIATVSHELRTPLTAILGPLALVKAGETGPLPPEAQTFVDIAFANSERLAALINDILDLEKMDTGAMPFDLVQVDVAQLLEEARHLHAGVATQKGVRLAAEADAGLFVRGDPHRLAQVLGNLLSNALKYSNPGGQVRLSARRTDGMVRIEVQDEGPGVPEAFRDKIFSRFAQADGTDTRSRGGTGLGLAICKSLVERMHGRIGFDSAPGGGSRFWFELPAR